MVKTMEQIVEILQAPTPPEEIKFLPRDIRQDGTSKENGTALAIPHITARFTQTRLDEACGPFGWQSEVKEMGGRVCVGIGILHPESVDRYIWKWDSGDEGKNESTGAKALISGGIKRAGYQWGIGRDSYDFQVRRLKCKIWIDPKRSKTKFRYWVEDPKQAKRGFNQTPEAAEGDEGNGAPEGHKGQEEKVERTADAAVTPAESRRLVFDFAIQKIEMSSREANEWIIKREIELGKTVDFYRAMYAELREIKKKNEMPPESTDLPAPPDPSTEV